MRIFGIVVTLALSIFLCNTAYATTEVSGTLNGNHIWTKANSPYLINSVSIPRDSSLTIEPGTIVKVADNRFPFIVDGTLTIGSGGGEQVVITSIKDDAVGGDTNGDTGATLPNSGDWREIMFNPGSIGNMTNTTIRYGGSSVYQPWTGGYFNFPLLSNKGGVLTLTNVMLSKSSNNALEQFSGTTTITNSTISDLSRGIINYGGSLTIGNNTFSNLGDYGVSVYAATNFNNDGGNNGGRGMYMAYSVEGNQTWSKDHLPYVVSSVSIPSGSSLTIAPGTVVKAAAGTFPFYVGGTLIIGSPSATEHAIITSITDDTVGGDTNGDGSITTPQAGDWKKITMNAGARVIITHAIITYGGATPPNYWTGGYFTYPLIENNGGMLSINNSQLAQSKYYGVLQNSGTTTITNSTLSNIAKFGVTASQGYLAVASTTFDTMERGVASNGGALEIGSNTFTNTSSYAVSIEGSYVGLTNHAGNSGTMGLFISQSISGTQTLPKDGLTYIVNSLAVPQGSSLIIMPGAVVKVPVNRNAFTIDGILTIGSAGGEQVVVTSITDDAAGGDTNGDGNSTTPASGDWRSIIFNQGAYATIANTIIRYGGASPYNTQTGGNDWLPAIKNNGGIFSLEHTTLTNNGNYGILQLSGTTTVSNSVIANTSRYGIWMTGGTAAIHNSSIHNNGTYGIYNASMGTIDATGNWWGNTGGPTHASNPFGGGDTVSNNVDFGLWLTEEPGALCAENCNSNVLFLPGIMGSTLYRHNPVTGTSVKVWEPFLGGVGTEQVTQLYMNPELATSNNTDVYAKEILREDWSGSSYYKTFTEKMDSISGEGMSINEWTAIPYDWRLAPDEIIASGKKDGAYISYLKSTSTPYIIQELKRLAASSKTGKVTIVAHSYGGLVTKALIDALGTTTTQALVDDIVFVAVPQVGTPQAIAGMLYGKNQDLGFGLAVTEEEAQSFAATLPMAYTLLPSRGYFTSVHEQVVGLPADDRFVSWRALYGNLIGNWDELHSFLTTASDRELLQNLLVSSGIPPTLNHIAHMRALATHNVADTWIPPDGVSLTQIAGWGIPKTVKGITFKGKPNVYCSRSDTVCQDTRSWQLIPGYDTTMDGDGTVVTPSALWTSASAGAVNYWVNLKKYGRSNFLTTINREHGDILEVPELMSFITDILTQSTKPLADYTYLSKTVPTDTSPRLRYTLHSPLTLDLYDDHGRHTGVSTTTGQIETQIPGTYFSQIGEVKYLFTDASSTGHIIMDGYATGTFTFAVEELQGDILIASTTWKDIPTTPNTRVNVSIESDITTISPMQIDRDGNGVMDFSLPPQPNGVVTMPKPALTITANSQMVFLGSQLPLLTATMSGFVDGDVVSTSILGVPQCTTTATSTSSVGTYSIHCTIGTLSSDTYEFTTFAAGTLKVLYRFNGFTQPINDTVYNPTQSMSVFKGGSTVPVKFQLKNASGTAVQSSASPIWLTPQKLSTMSAPIDESAYSDPASSGSTFKWDSTSQQYIYNWSTKGLAAGYWYRLSAKLEDGILYAVMVGVR